MWLVLLSRWCFDINVANFVPLMLHGHWDTTYGDIESYFLSLNLYLFLFSLLFLFFALILTSFFLESLVAHEID